MQPIPWCSGWVSDVVKNPLVGQFDMISEATEDTLHPSTGEAPREQLLSSFGKNLTGQLSRSGPTHAVRQNVSPSSALIRKVSSLFERFKPGSDFPKEMIWSIRLSKKRSQESWRGRKPCADYSRDEDLTWTHPYFNCNGTSGQAIIDASVILMQHLRQPK